MKPIVALVGRPNVGKSTLFNRLTRRRSAIVHDEPGVTRDRHYGDVFLEDRSFLLVDTGGFDPTSDDPMRQGIKKQIEVAIAEADVIVCVLDGSIVITPVPSFTTQHHQPEASVPADVSASVHVLVHRRTVPLSPATAV